MVTIEALIVTPPLPQPWRAPEQPPQQKNRERSLPVEDVNMISVGMVDEARREPAEPFGSMKRTEKEITFSEEDMVSVQFLHGCGSCNTIMYTVSWLMVKVQLNLILFNIFLDESMDYIVSWLIVKVQLYFILSSLFLDEFVDHLERYGSLIQGFSGDPVPPERTITLLIKVGTYYQHITVQMNFLGVKLPAPYNAILEQPRFYALDAMISVKYLIVKFPTSHGVGQIKGSQAMA